MKLYKLNQGSTFENLKHFIYLTNEYGVPSDEFVDAFIDQFGKIILNGNFTITKNQIKQLNELWISIVKDCTHNNVEYRENYNSLFYIILSTKALDKIKEGWEQSEWNQLTEQDRLELLKQFIIDFDKYIQDGIDMADYLYFENTPELIRKDENGEEYIKIHMNESDRGLCTARLYRDSTTIIEIGSCIGGITQTAIDRPSLYNRIIVARNGKVHNNIVTSEIVCKSPSGAGQVYRGFTCNGWVSWYNERGELIDTYREKSAVSNFYVEASKIDKQAEDAARLNALINQNIVVDEESIVNKQKYNYKLTDEMYIGHELTITESVDDIKSSYKVKVVDNVNVQLTDTNLIIDINKFIEEIENRNVQLTITMGFFKFEDIYMEEK